MAAVPVSVVAPTKLRRITGESGTRLVIPARIGYRHILYDIFAKVSQPFNYFDIAVGTRTVLRLSDSHGSNDYVNRLFVKYNGRGFLWTLGKLLGEQHLPNAAEDEDIIIASAQDVGRLDAYYAEVKAEDVKSHTVPGGSDAPVRILCEIFDAKLTSVGPGQDVTFENMPPGLGLLDKTGRVKPTIRFSMHILAASYDISDALNLTRYTKLHVFDEDSELYTPVTHEGLSIDDATADSDLAYSFRSVNLGFFPDEPYVWLPNHQLTLKADVESVTGTGSKLRVVMMGLAEMVGGA
jgi:hypothetical protein